MGTSVQLRLPVVQRSTSAPIAMQGWLHKQGSEGLMLWKKRWFVLAEYCLFYYKNSEENRLLGSILLPSYKISPCSAIEGKIFRKKNSFKAEHANMRTYYFAADSREQMVQWMNAMSLATIAQQSNGPSQSSTLKSDKVSFHFGNNYTNRTSDVDATRNGSTGGMWPRLKERNSGSCSSGGGTAENSSIQPLYVNAPPKPRRVTDPSESSTDNDFSNANSPTTNDLLFRDDRIYQPSYVKKVLANVTQSQLNGMNERRTPDVYSRASSVDPQPLTYSRCKVYKQSNTDYEELYNLTTMNNNNSSNGSESTNVTQTHHSRMSFHTNSSTIERSAKTAIGYRPRSVDFLEAQSKHNEGKTNPEYATPVIRARTNSRNYSQGVLAPRPKSSVDIVNLDGFYWSEERYAQNMRKSAQYLVAKKLPSPSDVLKQLNEFNKLPMRSKTYVHSPGAANVTPKTNKMFEGCGAEVETGKDGRTHGAVDVLTNSADNNNTSVQPKQYGQQRSDYSVDDSKAYESLNRSDFIRSKSARIQREKERDIADHTLVESPNRRRNSLQLSESADRTNQQTQQREESMKRLLEWKQRMLQSPLSRKSSGSSNRGVAQNDLFSNYKPFCSNAQEMYLMENANGLKIPERDSGLKRNNQSWHMSDGDEDELLADDTRNSASTNIDTSTQPNRNYQKQQEGRNSVNSLRKFDSESSDDEGLNSGQEIGKRTRSGSLLSSNDSSSTLIRMSPNNVDINHSRCMSPFPIKCTNGPLNSVKQLDSGYTTIKMESKLSDASPIKFTDTETLRGGSNDSPTTNLVQSRIRVFEKLPDPKPIETLCLREPLTASSAHKLNRAFVSLIKNDIKESDIILSASSSRLSDDQKRLARVDPLLNTRTAQYFENFEWNGSYNDGDYTKNVELNGLQQMIDTSSYNHLSKESTCVHKDVEENLSLGSSGTRQIHVHEKASISEEHYLPMAPSKKTYSAPPGDLFYHTRSNSASSASQILILETLLSEDVENSYVEMTVDKNGRFYHEPKKLQGVSISADNVCQKSPTHYEFLYKASSSNEPLYTEVTSTEKWFGNEKSSEIESSTVQGPTPPTQSILPDILNSSNTLRQLTDSSDADDEASKEFIPKDMPRNPRFSLSDTFRPASYYLGNNYEGDEGNDMRFRGCSTPFNMPGMRNTLNLSFDQPDSSDSDLVSPPPIPTSPASLNAFEISIDSAKELVNGQHNSLSETDSFSASDGAANGNNKPAKEKAGSDLESTTESYSSTITTLPETMYDDYNRGDKDDERTLETLVYKNMSLTFEGQMGIQRTQSHSADVVESSTISSAGSVTHLGAPYYYADLLKLNSESAIGIAESAAGATSDHSPQDIDKSRSQQEGTLNNKREQCLDELTAVSKRNNVGKKVNQIAAEKYFSDKNYKMVAHMKNKMQLLRVTDKNVDDKNIYSSHAFQSKLHKSDFRSKTPEPLSDTVNLYTTTQNYHSNDGEISKNLPYSRRSRSLEGLLDGDTPKNNLVWNNSKMRWNEPLGSTSSVPVPLPTPSTSSSDILEEDRLWRENLRRMSLRHAHSLDNLDKGETKIDVVKSGRQSADILGTDSSEGNKNKLTREVTYVNNCVSLQMRKAKQNAKEYTEDYREVRRIKRYARTTPAADNVDDGVHYERLDPRAMLPVRSANYLGRNVASQGSVSDERALSNMKQHGKHNTQPKSGAQSFLEEGVYPTKPPSFEIDREKLRQWDLMSSAPVAMLNAIQRYPVSDGQSVVATAHVHHQTANPNGIQVTLTMDQRNTPPPSPAYGSDSATGHNTLPPPNSLQTSVNLEGVPQADARVVVVGSTVSSAHYQQYQSRVNDVPSHSPLLSSDIHTKKSSDSAWNLNVSAGELLGHTHEELVLLLIQLRRQSASLCKAMENCHREIEKQATIAEIETPKKVEYLNRVEDLKKRLNELEKLYEKGKPLVNLVDNMVKLGSLYRSGTASSTAQLVSGPLREKLEFNHRVQEQRLLAEEQKEWERISPDHHQLQAKVEELYKLDRELQQESSTLQSLKQDKDLLENALGGLKHKIQGTQGNPTEMERYRRQQLLLERELSHVRSVLARNSKKLEETVTANARLEAELVILRQKLQWSQRPSEDSSISAPTVAALENELKRVQMLVGDLQRQRNELSTQVRQLTEKSNNLSQQIRPSPAGIAGAGPVLDRKKANSGWTETDLDGDTTHDTSTDCSSAMSPTVFQISAPLYANTKDRRIGDYFGNNRSELQNTKNAFPGDYHSNLFRSPPELQCGKPMDISESDDRTKRFYGILPREKSQEIKTVRIVKRESERRQRDRDRTGNVGIPVSLGGKRAASYDDSMSDIDKSHLLSVSEERGKGEGLLYRDCGYLQAGFSPSVSDYVEYGMSFESLVGAVASTENVTSNKIHQDETHGTIDSQRRQDAPVNKPVNQSSDSPQLSPVYQSEAAKRIVQELVSTPTRKDTNKRLVPKEKRRHHTVSSSKPLISTETYATHITRARDDVDMERALRPRLNAAPDVVRSTLSRTEPLKYNAETIDSVIGTPGKICIPERYVPETEPELSPEEQNRRLKKADAIRKMLSETTAVASVENAERNEHDVKFLNQKKKFEEDRRERDHILHLNQILAHQVTEKSKLVAGAILSNLS